MGFKMNVDNNKGLPKTICRAKSFLANYSSWSAISVNQCNKLQNKYLKSVFFFYAITCTFFSLDAKSFKIRFTVYFIKL